MSHPSLLKIHEEVRTIFTNNSHTDKVLHVLPYDMNNISMFDIYLKTSIDYETLLYSCLEFLLCNRAYFQTDPLFEIVWGKLNETARLVNTNLENACVARKLIFHNAGVKNVGISMEEIRHVRNTIHAINIYNRIITRELDVLSVRLLKYKQKKYEYIRVVNVLSELRDLLAAIKIKIIFEGTYMRHDAAYVADEINLLHYLKMTENYVSVNTKATLNAQDMLCRKRKWFLQFQRV